LATLLLRTPQLDSRRIKKAERNNWEEKRKRMENGKKGVTM